MKNLIIIGARGYGREVYGLAKHCAGYNTDYVIKGFLDDKSDALMGFDDYPEVISSVEAYVIQDEDVFICALGSVQWKKWYVEMILLKGGKFINLIHPTVIYDPGLKLGNGVIIFMYSNISNDCEIDDFVTIQGFVTIGHDSKIGKWCHINAYSFMGGYAALGEEVCLNTRATILPNIMVNRGATVGACSLVVRNVKENTTVFGVPAIKLKI
ncbi:acetyltransferase [Flavobacterium sp. WG21]|uniref:acetyltransferase n=1 Tax=Flavobacterium sp. WG21 TaxID=1229487 RepID=UPI00034B4A49|nr:acetyltransferase [Flavobacterium sp. WG21]